MGEPDISAWLPDLLDQFDDEVFVHTIDGEPIYANEATLRRLGLTREGFRALPPYGWVPEMSRRDTPRRIEELSVHGHARFESIYMTASGRIGAYEIRAKVLPLEGRPYVLSVGRDVTGRKHMAEDLRLRAILLDLVSDGVIVSDPDGDILYANNEAARLHGHRRHRLLQLKVSDLSLHPMHEEPRLSAEADTAFTADHLSATGAVVHLRIVARLIEHQGRQLVVRIMRQATE